MEAAVMFTVTEAVILMWHQPESQFTACVSKSLFLNDLHQTRTQKCLSVLKLLLLEDDDDSPLRHPLYMWTVVLFYCTARQFNFQMPYECACTK